jgi:hypothetical protein
MAMPSFRATGREGSLRNGFTPALAAAVALVTACLAAAPASAAAPQSASALVENSQALSGREAPYRRTHRGSVSLSGR